jgi:threonine dehydrogenase-like Zn-dependent dehydrogenase
MKRLRISFAAGEEQQDLDLALKSIADGTIDVRPWLGASVGLNGVADALNAMSDPASASVPSSTPDGADTSRSDCDQ